MLKILTAVTEYDEMNKPYACSYLFDVCNEEIDIKAGLQKALNDFVKTEEGRKVYEEYDGTFDIIDIINNVPNKFFIPYGFKLVDALEEKISLSERFFAEL